MMATTLVARRAAAAGAAMVGRRGMASIAEVRAREIIDSRGNPTVECDVHLEDGSMHRASVPSGASTGVHEAVELRDGGMRYMGRGVTTAVHNAEDILGKAIKGMDPAQQQEIDNVLVAEDGTENKGRLGANAILGVSLAVAKAGAASRGVPLYRHFADMVGNEDLVLPVPSFNVINGGSHAGNKLAFQEFMILPLGAESFSQAMQMGCEVYHNLKSVIKSAYGQDATNVGDEGGFAPNIQSNTEGVELLMEAIKRAGYEAEVKIGMDVASSEFLTPDGGYDLAFKTPGETDVVSGPELANIYKELCDKYPIVSIEDPFDQDDWDNYSRMTADMGEQIQIVGDDLLVTNPARIAEAAEKRACNALLLKVNQIGSIWEAIEAVKMSKGHGWGVMTSHRSGETEDNYIADLAVGLCTGQIKTGAPARSERLAKYNQLLRIEEDIRRTTGQEPAYAGNTFRAPAWMG